ncbi:uncharacterized protein LOC120634136 [Pararge aegeria]|uniref:uncharacterized protein LOC120634136 n=1 Tax=Pararge aegeria TaxID=116150 RepID=UPI0019CF9DCD|nr:uncharacterized protein LOC120634136 [Pararge aegeria]XP_039760474.1 uncharacterized protein LOC120634136 [Pararge aegeria]XP_039760476.1 uncharacterized protein LOC120634136 [Pararge aegeria]XP_039760477.1 uncharacterized protein LOC120634136 [Pararge aegeria]XP_039760478.1 uncharacterized protein LOC120634136 [Pararge aegeria]
MAPLMIEGETLGDKHRNYNKIVNEKIKSNPTKTIAAINYEEPDLDNLCKIDIACKIRNVEYILEILKCDDMLYVSRVIKKCTWLITDQQYAYIINPAYLYNNLYQQMTSKAFNKLVLHIRLNLDDEKRVEEFFNFYKQNDLDKAMHWLPRCSIGFIEGIIRNHANDIPKNLLKRLYEKSFTFLDILVQNYNASYYVDHLIEPGMFLLKINLDKFLDIFETLKDGDTPKFGRKYTKLVMEKCPERIKNNLKRYVYVLDISVFAQYLKKEEVKDFILTHIKNKKTRSWFTYKKIKYFLNRLPFEERFDFVKKLFIEKSCKEEPLENETWDDIIEYCNLPLKGKLTSSKNIYSWYVYAPFNKAFEDLKLLIRNESNPSERIWILRSILTCALGNQNNILTLLKYYHKNHINEPFMFKVQFVNHLITKTDTHKYDEEAWGYLNDIFNSLEVYTRSKDSVQSCLKSILFYNVIHDVQIPEDIESKFDFKHYISYGYGDCRNKFNMEETQKIFNYFYSYYISKVKINITSEKEFDETVDIILSVLKVLDIWNKELKDYPFVLQRIKDLVIIKKDSSWKQDLSSLYNFKKSWRKILFTESIILSPNQDSCMNALKHSPELLESHTKEINACINDKVLYFGRFLRKIQIYYQYQSLSDSFKATFLENLNQMSLHKSSITGLCILLTRKELLDFVQKYVPREAKIVWNQHDDAMLSIRKNVAACMHLSRPHLPLDVVLLYAKGDYLKYVLPSLNAIFYNINSKQMAEHLPKLLNAPVSLKKHGIRVAFAKLKQKELINMFTEIWKSNKNRSIRKEIVCETFKMLCKETDETVMFYIWEMFRMFVNDLTFEENKKIYFTLSQAQKVPLNIRASFLMRSYEFLEKLPAEANCENLIDELKTKMGDIMEFLDVDFMAKLFLENFDKKFDTQKYSYSTYVAMFLLSTKSESVQCERYKKCFEPIVEKAVAVWNKQHGTVYYARKNLQDIFNTMFMKFDSLVLDQEMIFPIAMYTAALNQLQSVLSIKANYFLLTHIKLSLGYIQIVSDLKTKCSGLKYNLLLKEAAPSFGALCLNYLKKDVADHFSTIYIIFGKVLSLICDQYAKHDTVFKMGVLKAFLSDKNFIEGYLLVTELMPTSNYFCGSSETALQLDMLKELSIHHSEEVVSHYWLIRKDLYYFCY